MFIGSKITAQFYLSFAVMSVHSAVQHEDQNKMKKNDIFYFIFVTLIPYLSH